MNFLKSVWTWVKWIVMVLLLGALGIAAVKVRGSVMESKVGKVKASDRWKPDPLNDKAILIYDGDSFRRVFLPVKVTSKQVKAVEVVKPGIATVELLHEVRDRRKG